VGRHLAQVSPTKRLAGGALGGVVVALLAIGLGFIGAQSDAGEAVALADTTTTTPTTAPTTVATSAIQTTEQPTTTTTRPMTTTTRGPTTTTLPPIVLESDGLGIVDLGATVDETIEIIASRLGGADSDSGWVNATGSFGTCPGNIVRVVRWASLRLFFSDGPTEFGEDARHFFFYSQSPVETDTVIDLKTEEGIGIGSTVAELRAAYGPSVTISSDTHFGVTFTIDTGEPGLLSGTLTESIDTGLVTSLAGGFGCGA
jgi:hypothetical protein